MFLKLFKYNVLLVVIFSFFLLNCGYEFTTFKETTVNIKKISVGYIENKTNEVSLKGLFTNELTKQLNVRYNVELVPVLESDFVVTGNILSISTYRLPVEFFKEGAIHNTKVECLTMSVEISVKNSEGILIWHADNISEVYYYTLNLYVEKDNDCSRRESIKYLVEKICASILIKIFGKS